MSQDQVHVERQTIRLWASSSAGKSQVTCTNISRQTGLHQIHQIRQKSMGSITYTYLQAAFYAVSGDHKQEHKLLVSDERDLVFKWYYY